ncbi:hypothetical protein MKW92_000882 [Papaver armeniacum]|nr:hypothetical protein MKW92_000882 [Papaver armeniacum]
MVSSLKMIYIYIDNHNISKRFTTMSVSLVIEIGYYSVQILSTSGDTHLGGDDFDKRIVDWLAASFRRDENIDLLKDKQAFQRLSETAEKTKKELSSLTEANISLCSIIATVDDPKHIETTLTRAKFEALCSDLFDRLKAPVKNCLRDAWLTFNDLDEVILIGGSTRTPAVQKADWQRSNRHNLEKPSIELLLVDSKQLADTFCRLLLSEMRKAHRLTQSRYAFHLTQICQVESMVMEAERFAGEDNEKNQAGSVICNRQKKLSELREKIEASGMKMRANSISEIIKLWI